MWLKRLKHFIDFNLIKRIKLIIPKQIMSSVENKDLNDNGSKTPTTTIKEGLAEIITEGHVFYNPVQEFNRDLSICVLSVFSEMYRNEQLAIRERHAKLPPNNTKASQEIELKGDYEGLTILEALSATGLRSIRYAKEIPNVKKIIANDLSKSAVASIERNIKHNQVEDKVVSSHADATVLMYTSTAPEKRFTVVDLDPYGCPTRFLDAALQSIEDGGLLLVTATDMAVLCGNTPESCYVKYGSIPLRNKACHEMALRILLKSIECTAIKYGRFIKPLLSVSADFYIRVFLRINSSPFECKRSSSKQSMVYQCTGCDTLTLQPLGTLKPNPTDSNPKQVKFGIPTGPFVNTNCEHCGNRHHMGGPIWSAPIHDQDFVQSLLKLTQSEPYSNMTTNKRIFGMLTVVSEELPDVPLYYALDKLCCVLKLEMIPMLKFRSAILQTNHRVSSSHACKSSIKTDATMTVLWDILRCWAKLHPVKAAKMTPERPLTKILEKESSIEINFDEIHPQANPSSRKNCLSRFQQNPAAHWGPGTRSTLMIGHGQMLKSIRKQNKRKNKRTENSKSEQAEPSSSPDTKTSKLS